MDSSSIRLLEVEGRRVVRWGSAAVEPGMVNDGVVAEPEALGIVLRGLMRATGIRPAPVVASVAGVNSLTRILSLPVLTGSAAAEAVLAAAREALFVPLEGLHVSWRPLSVNEGEQQYLLLAVPREVLDSQVLALRAAGLKLRELSLKGLALARAIGVPDALIVNVEPAGLDVVVVAEGIPWVLHSVGRADDVLPPEERAEAVARDLDQAVDFYHRRYRSNSSSADTPLFLAGPLMADAGFAGALQNAVGYPVATLKPAIECPRHLPLAQYAVNLGLALSRVPSPAPGGEAAALLPAINLLPRQRRRWYLSPRYGALAAALAAALVGLVGLYQATTSAMGDTGLLRQRMELVDLRLEQIRKENAARGQLEKQLAEYRGLTADREMVTGYLDLLEEVTPPGVELASINFAQKGIALQVSAATWEQAEAYIEALRETGHFAEVSLRGEVGTGEGGVSFAIEPKFPQGGPRLIE
jgi:Tfp pilus assembly PilM family ATPase/Tfp pilus assembly protein PilN